MGVGGPRALEPNNLSTLEGILVLFVSSVSVVRVGDDAPSSKVTTDARRSVRLKGLYIPSMPSISFKVRRFR